MVEVEFQSTRPHGARLALGYEISGNEEFQSTRPHGARPLSAGTLSSRPSFNPRARTGRDRGGTRTPWRSSRFNPRARTGRDLAPVMLWRSLRRFQSTRPHGARRLVPRLRPKPKMVSIHAPARGATGAAWPDAVSIHAPARGATVNICRNITLRIASMQVIHHERLECAPVAQYTSKKTRTSGHYAIAWGSRKHSVCQISRRPSGSYERSTPSFSTRPFQFLPRLYIRRLSISPSMTFSSRCLRSSYCAGSTRHSNTEHWTR